MAAVIERFVPTNVDVAPIPLRVENVPVEPAVSATPPGFRAKYRARHDALYELSFPQEKVRLPLYTEFIDFVRTPNERTELSRDEVLDVGSRFATEWMTDHDRPHVQRKVEIALRNAAKDAGNEDVGKLPRLEHSKLGNCMEILGQGNTLPTTAEDAKEMLENEENEANRERLTTILDALTIDENEGGSRKRTTLRRRGVSVSMGFAAAAQTEKGHVRRFDPETGERRKSSYKTKGTRVFIKAKKKITYEDETHIEKTTSIAGMSHSEGDPVLGPHDKVGFGPVEFAFGEKSGIKFGTPPAAAVGALVALRYPTAGHAMMLLGPLRYQGSMYIGGDARLDGIKEKAAKISALVPRPKIWEGIKTKWNNRSEKNHAAVAPVRMEAELDGLVVVATAEELVREAEKKTLKTT